MPQVRASLRTVGALLLRVRHAGPCYPSVSGLLLPGAQEVTSSSGPARERGGVPMPQDGAPSSIDVLAAQVRKELVGRVFGPPRKRLDAALDALVARVTEAEAIAAEYRQAVWEHLIYPGDDGCTASGYSQSDIPDELLLAAIVDESSALADARNALERVRPMAEEIRDEVVARTMEIQRARMWSRDRDPGHWTRYERHLAEAVNEVLARLDGSSGE